MKLPEYRQWWLVCPCKVNISADAQRARWVCRAAAQPVPCARSEYGCPVWQALRKL